MKNQKYPKLLSIAILSTMFIVSFCLKAEERENQAGKNQGQKMTHAEALAHSGTAGTSAVENGSTTYRLHQNTKVPNGQVELDYWIRWKNQFVWTLPGNGSALLPRKTGC